MLPSLDLGLLVPWLLPTLRFVLTFGGGKQGQRLAARSLLPQCPTDQINVRWGPDAPVSESPSARKRRGAKLVVILG